MQGAGGIELQLNGDVAVDDAVGRADGQALDGDGAVAAVDAGVLEFGAEGLGVGREREEAEQG
jgi:hypothetical protein